MYSPQLLKHEEILIASGICLRNIEGSNQIASEKIMNYKNNTINVISIFF